MAKAIKQIDKVQITEEEERSEAISEIMKELADNREAVSNTLEILQELQKAGVLDMVKGFLKTREKIGSIAMEQINQPSMHNMIKNGFNTVEFLGSLDPDQMEKIFKGINQGLDETSKQPERQEKMGVFGMMRALKNPNINASLTTMFSFLNGMGKAFGKKQAH